MDGRGDGERFLCRKMNEFTTQDARKERHLQCAMTMRNNSVCVGAFSERFAIIHGDRVINDGNGVYYTNPVITIWMVGGLLLYRASHKISTV